jgi:hypothetical protein
MIDLAKIIVILLVVQLSSLQTSCVAQRQEGSEHVPENLYDLSIAYDEEEEAFFFNLTSFAKREICIPRMRWPSESGGHYFFGDISIYVVIDGGQFRIKDGVSGHCTPTKNGPCVHVLKQNDELLGKLAIRDFEVPVEVDLTGKLEPELRFPYTPNYCAN